MNARLQQSFWFNLLLVALVALFLYVSFFFTLGFLTHHGEKIKIPNVAGKPIATAKTELEAMGFNVVVDSLFDKDKKPLAVLKQIPDAGQTVKSGRTVMLTANRTVPPSIKMISLTGLSFENAVIQLANNNLRLGDTMNVYSYNDNMVEQQLYKNRTIPAGETIPEGSVISLVIGTSKGSPQHPVPDLVGQNVDYALTMQKELKLAEYLYIVPIDGGEIIDTLESIVIEQDPMPYDDNGNRNMIREGEKINIHIKQKPAPDDLKRRPAPANADVPDKSKGQ
ncbi:MAG: PASTA domain-containing protein [Chitinophagia bacterium]|nr:PASTA domain-containing protein [Chitinophagia bacterium]